MMKRFIERKEGVGGASRQKHSRASQVRGFTLVEILVSCAVLGGILLLMLSVLNHASNFWKSSNARIDSFQGARLGFENLTRLLSQACLNTYWDYSYDSQGNPQRYIRQSELHFLVDNAASVFGNTERFPGQAVFFQAPANYSRDDNDPNINSSHANYALTDLLNACAFYVEFASDRDKGWVPSHVQGPERKRFRLMQWTESTQKLSIYRLPSDSGLGWVSQTEVLRDAIPVADNIIALVIWPKEPERQSVKVLPDIYQYDSRSGANDIPQPPNANQLPPMLQVAMVAIDEGTAVRFEDRLQSVIQECLGNRFQNRPSDFEEDLKGLEADLTAKKITFRTFISTISLHETKWSPDAQ